MATYNQERIIREYWEIVKEEYPNLSFEQFAEICKFPAIFIKDEMKSGRLNTIMVKYLGKFIVYPSKVKQELGTQRIFFEGKSITAEVFKERIDLMNNFLERFNQGYNTYELSEDDFDETETTD